MTADGWHDFLRWALPRLRLRQRGYERVHRRVRKQVGRRMRELRLTDLAAYRHHLLSHEDEWGVLDRLCRVVISRCCRDRACFDRLRDAWLPDAVHRARAAGRPCVEVFSAGCACGEEPWSVRLLWDLELAREFADVELRIVATDVDPRVLERARQAVYPASSLRELPQQWRANGCFERVARGFRLADAHRHGVQFLQQDLRTAVPDARFDVILCRNVAFTYFGEDLQRTVLASLRSCLQPGGVIVIGAREQLPCE